jgi:NADH-ubiquinone oxidoreductase chain 4
MNLIYIVILPLVFTGLILILSANNIKSNKYECIYKTPDVFYTLEEKYFSVPYVLEKYFSHILDVRRNLPSSILSKSYWSENIEIYKIKVKEINKKIFNTINSKIGVGCSLIIYLLLLTLWSKFERTDLKYQNLCKLGDRDNFPAEINSLDIWLGLDALSLPFILLTGFIMPIVYLSNWTTICEFNDYYVVIILGLEVFLIGVFLVIDFLMFYIFFESILPLLFVLIGLYGAAQKFRAGYYLFLYTLFGSLFMLLSFVKLGGDTASTFFECYAEDSTFHLLQQIIWTVLFVSFSVKTPLVPVHIWLPLAHSDANVSGSIILASIVLKLALYGFIRILIGILYLATTRLTSFFLGYCSMSLVFSSFTTVRQFDLKVLVAYSSIAHMASSLLGTFSDTLYGLIGSVIFGLAHGFVSPGLFIIVGAVLYDRYGTRVINYFKGLSNILPFTALIFLILVFGNMGVPLTGNFVGEFMSLIGVYQQNIFIATIGTISVILSAIYSINTFNKTTSGSISPYVLTVPDLFRKEYYTLLPLIVLTLILGIYPSFISSDIEYGLSSNLMLLPIICNNINSKNEDIQSNEKNNYHSNYENSIYNSFVENENNSNNITNIIYWDRHDLDDLLRIGIIPPNNSSIIPSVKPMPILKPDCKKTPKNKSEA